jgi:hypothetical protein
MIPGFRYITTLPILCVVVCIACNGAQLSKRKAAQITREATDMLHNYHKDLAAHGLAAEFKYLDSTDQFNWHPAGYDTAIGFDSVATVLRRLDDFYTSIKSHWDTLSITPLSDSMADYTGIFTTSMTDVSGITDTYTMHESGRLVRRPDGWKMLSGRTSIMPGVK